MERKQKKIWVIGGLAVIVMINGCTSTPRGLQHVPSKPALIQEKIQSSEDQSFAAAAGKLTVGSVVVIQETPLNSSAQVTVRSEYVNALGEECKKLLVKNKEAEMACSICLGKDAVWRYIQNIQ